MTPEEDRQATLLMQCAQRGDQDAYAALLILATSAVRRLVRARWGEVRWMDDAVQETLLSVHRARHTFDPERAFAPWLYAIAQNRIIDVARREQRIGEREQARDSLPEQAAFDVTADADCEVDIARVRAALAKLPPRQRAVIVAMKLEEQSAREVGARFGMSASAVKVTAHRGYKVLRRLLGGPADGE